MCRSSHCCWRSFRSRRYESFCADVVVLTRSVGALDGNVGPMTPGDSRLVLAPSYVAARVGCPFVPFVNALCTVPLTSTTLPVPDAPTTFVFVTLFVFPPHSSSRTHCHSIAQTRASKSTLLLLLRVPLVFFRLFFLPFQLSAKMDRWCVLKDNLLYLYQSPQVSSLASLVKAHSSLCFQDATPVQCLPVGPTLQQAHPHHRFLPARIVRGTLDFAAQGPPSHCVASLEPPSGRVSTHQGRRSLTRLLPRRQITPDSENIDFFLLQPQSVRRVLRHSRFSPVCCTRRTTCNDSGANCCAGAACRVPKCLARRSTRCWSASSASRPFPSWSRRWSAIWTPTRCRCALSDCWCARRPTARC